MVRLIPSIVLIVTAGTAGACPSFGFDTPYLSDFFCGQLDEIAGPTTRAIDQGSSPSREGQDDLTHPEPEWMTLPVIQEAWRSDPAKTLKLIERIRDAGGRPLK